MFYLPYTWWRGVPIGEPTTLVEAFHDVRENCSGLIEDTLQRGHLQLVGQPQIVQRPDVHCELKHAGICTFPVYTKDSGFGQRDFWESRPYYVSCNKIILSHQGSHTCNCF